jgi:hypothetical protein
MPRVGAVGGNLSLTVISVSGLGLILAHEPWKSLIGNAVTLARQSLDGQPMATVNRLALAAVLSVAAFVPATAFADDDEEMPPMAPAGPQPVYTAPLSQTTQPTYVPQSVALSGPEEIEDYDFSRPIPAGYTVVKRKRLGMLIGGGVTFGVSYGYALLFAAAGHDEAQGYDYEGTGEQKNELAALAVPIAGPFLQMAETDSATTSLAT